MGHMHMPIFLGLTDGDDHDIMVDDDPNFGSDTYSEGGSTIPDFVVINGHNYYGIETSMNWYLAGDEIRLVATLQNATETMSSQTVTGNIIKPDGKVLNVQFYDNRQSSDYKANDGRYTYMLSDTSKPGFYNVEVTASGEISGADVERKDTLSFEVVGEEETEEAYFSGLLNNKDYSSSDTVSGFIYVENYGTTTYDDVSNNDGTLNSTTWAAGRFGHALDFNETGGYVQISDDASIDFNAETDSFTITTWVNAIGATGTSQYIVNKQSGGFNPGYHLFLKNNGKLSFMIHTTAGNSDFGNVEGNTNLIGTDWHHIAAVYNASANTMDIYVDGNSDGATVNYAPTASSLNNEPLFIGTHDPANGKYLNGSIDEAVIYNRALTQSEIQGLYNRTLSAEQRSVTVWATDAAGNQNSATRWFDVY